MAAIPVLARPSPGGLPLSAAVPVRGAIWMDDGAVHAIRDRHKSLFPVGVIKVVGEFSAQVRAAHMHVRVEHTVHNSHNASTFGAKQCPPFM